MDEVLKVNTNDELIASDKKTDKNEKKQAYSVMFVEICNTTKSIAIVLMHNQFLLHKL